MFLKADKHIKDYLAAEEYQLKKAMILLFASFNKDKELIREICLNWDRFLDLFPHPKRPNQNISSSLYFLNKFLINLEKKSIFLEKKSFCHKTRTYIPVNTVQDFNQFSEHLVFTLLSQEDSEIFPVCYSKQINRADLLFCLKYETEKHDYKVGIREIHDNYSYINDFFIKLLADFENLNA
jgi:hypothetical protein